MEKEQLAEELHKSICREFEKDNVYSFIKHNIWGANLADMQLTSKYNKKFCYAWWFFRRQNKRMYEQIKAVNFTIDQWNLGYMTMI